MLRHLKQKHIGTHLCSLYFYCKIINYNLKITVMNRNLVFSLTTASFKFGVNLNWSGRWNMKINL